MAVKKTGKKAAAVKKTTTTRRSPAESAKTPPPTQKNSNKDKVSQKLWRHQLLTDPKVRQMLIDVGGEHTLHIIGKFAGDMSDEEIAKKTELRTSDVRAALNRLHSWGLVAYSRSRDKNSGWYSYVWKMNNGKAREIIGQMQTRIDNALPRVECFEEAGEFYSCDNCGPKMRVPFETASETLFKCRQCGTDMQYFEVRE